MPSGKSLWITKHQEPFPVSSTANSLVRTETWNPYGKTSRLYLWKWNTFYSKNWWLNRKQILTFSNAEYFYIWFLRRRGKRTNWYQIIILRRHFWGKFFNGSWLILSASSAVSWEFCRMTSFSVMVLEFLRSHRIKIRAARTPRESSPEETEAHRGPHSNMFNVLYKVCLHYFNKCVFQATMYWLPPFCQVLQKTLGVDNSSQTGWGLVGGTSC